MCDTILASPASSTEHAMLFGKNSDRQRNEAQAIEYFPPADHVAGTQLRCTYIAVPQVQRTHAVLLCRPFWIWGAEMGANDHGVVIGNEGLQARSPPPQQEALIGMDLLRLALERASTAAQAVDIIVSLLERYGQGGNCGHPKAAYYNNGFVIADSKEGFVLETVDREWLVERAQEIRTMSNRYSIGKAVERTSAGVPAMLREFGFDQQGEFNYAELIAAPNREHIGNAAARHARSTSLLSSHGSRLTVADMMRVLRDHGDADQTESLWRPECAVKRTLCMHAGSEDRIGQTVGSMVSELHHTQAIHWVTGSSAPCMSIFKPLLMTVPLPPLGPTPAENFDESSLWWRHERLHRSALLGDFAMFLERIQPERDALEEDFRRRVKAVLKGGSPADQSRVIAACWGEAIETEDHWHRQIEAAPVPLDEAYVSGWTKMNRLAGVEPLLKRPT